MKATSTKAKSTTAKSASSKMPAKKAQASTPASNKNTQGPGGTSETPFEKLFEDLLKDVYWAEQHLVEALPKMAEAATTEALKDAIEDHLHVTKKHVKRLEKVFKLLGKPAEAKKCDAMEALVKEGEKAIEETPDGSMTRDAGIIISAQKVEHYEIASYGSLVQVAITLGHDEIADILEQTLAEEEETDAHLTKIAETDVNPMADNEGGEDGEDNNEEN